MEELGDVIVVPHLPLLVASMGGRHLVRSLVEFLDWYDDQQEEPETRVCGELSETSQLSGGLGG